VTIRALATGNGKRLTKATHASLLSPSWYSLYRLTKLDDDFDAAVADGTIRPDATDEIGRLG